MMRCCRWPEKSLLGRVAVEVAYAGYGQAMKQDRVLRPPGAMCKSHVEHPDRVTTLCVAISCRCTIHGLVLECAALPLPPETDHCSLNGVKHRCNPVGTCKSSCSAKPQQDRDLSGSYHRPRWPGLRWQAGRHVASGERDWRLSRTFRYYAGALHARAALMRGGPGS